MKKPFINKEQLEKITNDYPTPFHLYDEEGIRKNVQKLIKSFSWNKNYKQYFAVKATPNPYILEILKEEGCGVDCSSLTELMMVDRLGFSGQEIMFTSNVTPKEDFILARKLNALITLDDISHIDYLEEVAGLPETLSLRFNPGGNFTINNTIMDKPQEAKYGLTREQMTKAFKVLMKKGVKHFGIHAFLASNTIANDYYPALARILLKQPLN